MSQGMASNTGLEGLQAIASFYQELCPVQEGQVEDAGAGARITHDNIMGGVQIAGWRAVAAMTGRLECRELEAMERQCGERGDYLSQIQVATFHSYWHRLVALREMESSPAVAAPPSGAAHCGQECLKRTMAQATQLQLRGGPSQAGFTFKHLCTVSWWIGFEEAYVRENHKDALLTLKTVLHFSEQLTGLRRGWRFHVRYTLGNCLYQEAFNGYSGNTQGQETMWNMALLELVACGREISQQSEAVEDVSWALRAFGMAGKVALKLQLDSSKVRELYDEVAMYARKLGQAEWESLLSQLSSGVQELEDDNPAAGMKKFVVVLKYAVVSSPAGSDTLCGSFDLLAHACWWIDKSTRSLPFQHLIHKLGLPRLVEHVKANVAEGKMLLAQALTVLGQGKEALFYLEDVYKLLSDDQSDPTLHHMQVALARAYAEGQDNRQAAEMYEAASKTARSLQAQVELNMEAGSLWVKVPGEFVKGVGKMQAAVRVALQGLPCEWELHAFLCFSAGTAQLSAGDLKGGVEQLEAGRKLCDANAFAFALKEEGRYARDIVHGLALLLVGYLGKGDAAAALTLHQTVNPVLENLRSTVGESQVWTDTAWRNWQQAQEELINATGFPEDVVLEKRSARYSWDPELMLEQDIGGGSTYLFSVADHYTDLADEAAEMGDWEGAVKALNDLEEKLLGRGVLRKTAKVKLHLQRARHLWYTGDLPLQALEEIQKAVDMLPEVPGLAAAIYLEQARIYWKLQNPREANASIDKAEKSLGNGKGELFRVIAQCRSSLQNNARQPAAAAQLTREFGGLSLDTQSKLGIESTWVPFLDGTSRNELLNLQQQDPVKALIWSERGRAKELEADEFGRSDQYARATLWKALELSGPGTVIVECSIQPNNVLHLYLLFDHAAVGRGGSLTVLDMDEFFKIDANCVAGKSMEQVVLQVRKHIRAGEDELAMPGLTILHTLLVHSTLDKKDQFLRFCTNIIFAPDGLLHLVPFAALYDGSAKKFLIEQKAVGVIPSIRSLHRCFVRQQIWEDGLQSLDGAFIAGDPPPTGLERLALGQLPGAAQEAERVAKILGVEACQGDKLTKEVVVRALATSSVVFLATHGLTKSHGHPYGAVALRRRSPSDKNDVEDGFRDSDSPSEQEQVLTSDEIAGLKGGISAGLVVLSASHTGPPGDISREGLLGLGHAVLQAGAASAIVALWDVGEDSIGTLISDVFKELKNGVDVLHSVQKAMVDMLGGPEPTRKLKHWSALTVLGSPIFRLPGYRQASLEVSPKHDMLDCYSGSQLVADDIGGQVLYLRSLVHYYEDWARQREEEGFWDPAIKTVDFLEHRLQERGLVSAVAKSKLHLWRGKYMSQSQGGAQQALKEMQKAVEVLPDFAKTPQLAAQIFLEQAKAHLMLKDRDATSAALDKAQESGTRSKDSELLYRIKVFRTVALSFAEEFEAAADIAREAQLEAGLGDRSVWVPFVDDESLRNPFGLYETLSIEQYETDKALIWAERGRTCVSGDDGSFAGTDSDAVHSMHRTAALCGLDTIIIHLSYHHHNTLLVYGLHGKSCAFTQVFMRRFFSNDANCALGRSLEEVVSRVRHHISRGEDEKAIPGLSILYNLLVQTVVGRHGPPFNGATNIIFAPQGFLCQIPFAALYDASSKKFLVELKAVGVVPSLRALRRCFSLQGVLESSYHPEEDADAFVGGNPEPMGLKLEQLPGTAHAAEAVAEILGVEASPGKSIGKQVLLRALTSTRRIVMLATHSVGGQMQQPHPHGALVLKEARTAQDEVLTCEDLAALEGELRAGLVVLAASRRANREGAFGNHGLLGLGHAALQGGAVSTIASLWEVGEDILEPLISTIFTELKQGNDVLHSVQKAMAATLRSRAIRDWAFLTLLGSPTFRLVPA